jgi:hypothetical protein
MLGFAFHPDVRTFYCWPMFNRDEQGPAPTFGDIVQARLSRRGVLRA